MKKVIFAVLALLLLAVLVFAVPAMAQGNAPFCSPWTWSWFKSGPWWYWQWYQWCWNPQWGWNQIWGNWGWQ